MKRSLDETLIIMVVVGACELGSLLIVGNEFGVSGGHWLDSALRPGLWIYGLTISFGHASGIQVLAVVIGFLAYALLCGAISVFLYSTVRKVWARRGVR